jgi:hypothetical protein
LLAILACLLALGSAGAARKADLAPDALIVTPTQLAASHAAAATLVDRWSRLADNGAFDALSAEIAAASGLESELALAALVRHLRDTAAGRSNQGQAFLDDLSERSPRVWMRHEETRGDWFVPALDAGGEAASALWVIGRTQARERWQARLLADPAALAGGFAGEADARSAAEALRELPAGTLAAAAKAAARHAEHWPGPVLLALAERTRSASLYRAALERLEPAERVRAVADLPAHLDAREAQALLQRLSADPAVGSAAVLALGPYLDEPTVKAWLLDALGEPGIGASAAAALARHGGDDVVAALEGRAAKSASPALWRDLVLALRLHGSPAARRALERIAVDPRLPASLATEIRR